MHQEHVGKTREDPAVPSGVVRISCPIIVRTALSLLVFDCSCCRRPGDALKFCGRCDKPMTRGGRSNIIVKETLRTEAEPETVRCRTSQQINETKVVLLLEDADRLPAYSHYCQEQNRALALNSTRVVWEIHDEWTDVRAEFQGYSRDIGTRDVPSALPGENFCSEADEDY